MAYISYDIKEIVRINRMFSCFLADYENKYTFHGEYHNFWETVYVLSGSVCVSANERVYYLNEGDIIFHEPLELHKFYITSNNTQLLIFSYDLEGDSANFFRQKVFSLNKYQKSILSAMTAYMTASDATPYFITESSIEEDWLRYVTPINEDPAYGQNLVLYIYQLMLSLLNDGKRTQPSKTYESVLFSNTVKFMSEHLSQVLSVAEIAKHANVSVSGLKRIFEKCAGMGVHKYFLTLKLNEATILLEKGYSVSDVATRLGFDSLSYFSKVYKRELHCSPSRVKANKEA
ncbi:MAG: helix-turn-helix transcriptional regulator [Clostridia bacterium]|nr:helix-turn-helix transcriptional regulator [Clostridia bacterium]